MENIIRGIERALFDCMGLKQHEQLVIITDDKLANLSNLFYDVAKERGIHAAILQMTGLAMSGAEPPSLCGAAMRSADVAILLTEYSLSHTRAREKASSHGTRIASLPGFTRQMLAGPMLVDYEKMGKLTTRLSSYLDSAESAYLISDTGTEITMSLDDRAGFADLGIYRNPGECGNLPAGESYIAPQEETSNGKVVIDGSITNIGKLSEPLTLTVERGNVVKIEGGKEKIVLEDMLLIAGKGATNIAELGIGTNDWGIVTGVTLADEKILGTVHIGLGDNINYGGRVDSKCHLDCVMTNVSLYLDDVLVVDKGQIIV